MVSSRRRPGVFLLAIATMMFSLVLLSATSSRAQTEPEDQNNSAKAAVGDEECVEFENEGSNTGTTNGDTGTNTSEDTSFGVNQDNATGDSATDDNASGDNIASDNSTDDPNATYQNTDTDGDTGTDTGTMNQDAETANQDAGTGTNGEEGTDTGTTNQDAETANQDAGTGTNGEDFTTSQDEGTGSEDGTTLQDDATGSDGTTSSQDGETGNEECVVADTVPDESLLPTGAPASSSRSDEKTTEKKSDRDGEQEPRKGTTQEKTTNGEAHKRSNDAGKQQKAANSGTRKKASSGTQKKVSSDSKKKTSSGTQKKITGGEAQRKTNRSETQNRSVSGGTTQVKSNRSEAQSNSGSGGTVAVRGREVEVDDRAGKEPRQKELKARARSAAASDLAPRLAATEWTRPSRKEVASTGKPRNFAPNPNAGMTLSARALGLYDMPVTSSSQREDLDNGLVHVPETSRPWDEGDQKNVFIAGHYLGAPQTASRLAFYNLHKLKSGDELVLEDGRGQTYKYRVSEKFAVESGDSWAMGEVRDRDMVTLQTCIPPDFGKRLMVRADRVRA